MQLQCREGSSSTAPGLWDVRWHSSCITPVGFSALGKFVFAVGADQKQIHTETPWILEIHAEPCKPWGLWLWQQKGQPK